VFECCQEWKIEDKITTITMDNASSNDVAATNLTGKFKARKSTKFIPKYFHVRCCAHIINLIVNDGIAPLEPLIAKLRETVKYLKKSPLRMKQFLIDCKSLNIKVSKGLVDWWRLNAHRYPVIAKIARKFLTVPATSVSSESTFSTGGRVLDDYRSSLRPKMVEALVCGASFIKGSKNNSMKPTIPVVSLLVTIFLLAFIHSS
jgi:hypothetical protein